jgi:hypothetical protein
VKGAGDVSLVTTGIQRRFGQFAGSTSPFRVRAVDGSYVAPRSFDLLRTSLEQFVTFYPFSTYILVNFSRFYRPMGGPASYCWLEAPIANVLLNSVALRAGKAVLTRKFRVGQAGFR